VMIVLIVLKNKLNWSVLVIRFLLRFVFLVPMTSSSSSGIVYVLIQGEFDRIVVILSKFILLNYKKIRCSFHKLAVNSIISRID